jgi:hypothetical protein
VKKLPPNVCPVCGKPPASTCKCPRADSTCECGTQWHTCGFHKKIVLGHSDHSKNSDECTCAPLVVHDFGNMHVEHCGRNAVLRNIGTSGEVVVERADLRNVITALEEIARRENVE